MRGTHSQLVITTTLDEATGETKPLFYFPVQICKATGSTDVKFDRATPSGAGYDTVYRDQVTGEICEYGDLVRGVRSGDSFAPIAEEQIAAIDEAVSLDGIYVERSLPLSDVPFDRVIGRSFLQAPAKGGSHTAYRLTVDSLVEQPPKGKAKKVRPALAMQVKFTSRTRQKMGVVVPADERGEICGSDEAVCLVLLTMTFASDLRDADEAILAPSISAKPEPEKVGMARKVIEGLQPEGVTFDSPVDEAIEQKREKVAAAAQGEVIEVPEGAEEPEAEVVKADELEAVLAASLAA